MSWFDLGLAYEKSGNLDGAIQYYEKSFSLNHNYYKAALSLAMTYEKQRNLEKAAEFYTKALSLTEDPRIREVILRKITKGS